MPTSDSVVTAMRAATPAAVPDAARTSAAGAVPSARKVLFVAYGGGHIRALLPVALALQARGAAVSVLALTTARPVVQASGLRCLGFQDIAGASEPEVIAHGKRLLQGLASVTADETESIAYLGLNYVDLVRELGEIEAAQHYAQYARQAFRPLASLQTLLRQERSDLVVSTNAPRAERAAIEAAGIAGIASVCVVDLFALDEIAWIGQSGFATRVCVLSSAVRRSLLDAGRLPHEVLVTGNPAFDACTQEGAARAGAALKVKRGWAGTTVLYAPAPEPPTHPFRPGERGPVELPEQVAAHLQALATTLNFRLVVRPHPSFAAQPPPWLSRHELAEQAEPLEAVLHAVEVTVIMASTVAIQATLCGGAVVQVRGSLFEASAPFFAQGFADVLVDLPDLAQGLAQALAIGRSRARVVAPSALETAAHPTLEQTQGDPATPIGTASAQVLAVVDTLLAGLPPPARSV